MATEIACQTPGAEYTITVTPSRVSVEVWCPGQFNVSAAEASLLEDNLHNAVELVLAPYFNRDH